VATNGIEPGVVQARGEEGCPVAGLAQERCRRRHEPIRAAGEMRSCTAPGPILRPRHKPGADRIKLDVPGRSQNIVIVERARAEPPLPEMPDPALPLVDGTRVAAVHLAERSTQSVGIRGHKEEMDIVGIRQ
jgi:hypothetical protein